MSCKKEDYTLSFDEQVKGWTSFHSFYPDFMVGMNNMFYTFKDGELYIHNSEDSNRSTYYGTSFPSKVSLMVNQDPSTIKELQAVSLEGSKPWDLKLEAYVNDRKNFISSSIKEAEFVQKEGHWYAYARRNEDVLHNDSKSTYGIGTVDTVVGDTVTVNAKLSSITSGDTIYKGSDMSLISTIVTHSYNFTTGATTIELDAVTGQVLTDVLSPGDFILGKRDARIEGGNLRGYTMRMDLTVTSDDMVELFATNAEVMKSFT